MTLIARTTVPILAAAIATALAGCAQAASPGGSSLQQRIERAKGGERIVVPAGTQEALSIGGKRFSPAIRIEAQGARFPSIMIRQSSGIAIVGGAVTGPGRYAIDIAEARDISISGMRVSGTTRGIVVNRSQKVALVGNVLEDLRSDGINIALSQQVRVERNSCRNFSPQMAVFSAAGKRLRDGDHPDCIQAWSRPGSPPTSDLTIVDNRAEGLMQGIFLGNHVRKGVNDGGFDRVVIRGNWMRVGMPNGIAASGLRDAEIVDNVVETSPGAMLSGKPHIRVKSKLIFYGENVRACGNKVSAVPRNPGTQRCGR